MISDSASVAASHVNHRQCVAALRRIREPLVTVLPAVAEAMHLLANVRGGADILCDMLADGGVGLLPLDARDMSRVKQLMQKYRSLPMDFADAALVRVAERDGLTAILTFDKHFSVYRLPRRARFR